MSSNYRLLVKNADQVVVICNHGEKFLTKDGMKNLSVVENASIVIGRYNLVKLSASVKVIPSSNTRQCNVVASF